MPDRPITRLPVEPVEVTLPRQTLAEHISKRPASTDFAARAARLSEDMARGDAERAEYAKKFDHQVGTLSPERPPIVPPTSEEAVPAPSPLDMLMAGMLQPAV